MKKKHMLLIKFLAEFMLEMKRKKSLYLMMVPGIIVFFVFNYLPLGGLVVAFKDYNFKDGIFGSPWVGFNNFKFFMNSEDGWRAIKNTLYLNSIFLLVHTFAQVAFALMLNDVRSKYFKKVTQSMLFFPYFISWVIVGVFTYNILNYSYGSLNTFLKSLGYQPVNLFASPESWPLILTIIDTWKNLGFGMIIYLASLAGINIEYYEAAVIDGAKKMQQIWYISIPLLMPTITILTLLSIGKIMAADFGMFYSIIGDNSLLYSTADVIDTFVYRNLRQIGDVGMSSAAGFFQSIVGLLTVLGSNILARRFQEDGALF